MMNPKTNPPDAHAGPDDPERDADIYRPASPIVQAEAAVLRRRLTRIKKRQDAARAAGEFQRLHRLQDAAEPIACALADLENGDMPWTLRQHVPAFMAWLHPEFDRERTAAFFNEGSAPADTTRDDPQVAMDVDGSTIPARGFSINAFAPGAPVVPFTWDDDGASRK